jgi:hypothetical protein
VKIPRNLRCKSVKPAACNSRKKRLSPFLTIIRSNQRMKVARRTQHCVQTVAVCALEVAAIHPVVCFQVADDRLNGLPTFEHLPFLIGLRFELAPVFDVDARISLFYAPVAQVDIDGFRFHAGRLHQDAGLLEMLVQCVAVIRVAGKAACAYRSD